MVRAILDGRKTVTRRVVKPIVPKPCELRLMTEGYHAGEWHLYCEDPLLDGPNKSPRGAQYLPPFRIGDVLYVRETFNYGYFEASDKELDNRAWFEPLPIGEGVLSQGGFVYKADFSETELYEYGTEDRDGDLIPMPWKPPIHMPKEAARIFLRVTNVRVERLQKITPADAKKEGVGNLFLEAISYGVKDYHIPVSEAYGVAKEQFAHLWDSTINPADRDRYGWDTNPWVWVIEFERCEKQKGV